MEANRATKLILKLTIDKTANKVLFAAAKKDFVNVLFNLFYKPFVTVTSLLKNVGMVSCTANLFQSLENLSEAHLIPSQNTYELLKSILKWEKVSVLLQTHACLRPVPVQKKLYICQSNHRDNRVNYIRH
ncbi:hypothetical protein WN944_018333 [Citrus x changshan-huyou]|uniref:Uncharacterized protein n=1 Tax=Citrus x changshan-huyou TaxID=2935761 RepID=A0AAP0LZK0_9ROSI